MLLAQNRLNLCTANTLLSVGGILDCFASDANYTPSVTHYGLYGNSYVISSIFSHPDFVDEVKGDSVDSDLRYIPWAFGALQGEVACLNEATLRLTHASAHYVMLLRNYRPHMPRKLLDVFSYSTATYGVDIPSHGSRLELKEGDVVVLRGEKPDFCMTSRSVTTEPLTFNATWQIFVCLPDFTSFPGAHESLSKRGVCRQIRERVRAFVETYDITFDYGTKAFTLASNAVRYAAYENRRFGQLVKHTGRVYDENVEPSEDEDAVEDTDVVSFASMTVEDSGEGGRARKRALDEGEGEASSSSKMHKAGRPCD
jgi:hypothetical protein